MVVVFLIYYTNAAVEGFVCNKCCFFVEGGEGVIFRHCSTMITLKSSDFGVMCNAGQRLYRDKTWKI